MRRNFIYSLFTKKITIAKWQLNAVVLLSFAFGSIFGLYFLATGFLLPQILAATTPWTQTDWSGGQSSAVVTGTVATFASASNVVTTMAGQITLTEETGGWAEGIDRRFRMQLTIDHTKVGEDLTDFPVYVNLADLGPDFFDNVQDDGDDILVTDNTGTQVPRELVSIDTTNDTGELHFKAPTLSSSEDSVFYIYYGNDEATAPAPDAANGSENVWSNGYEAVYHMEVGDVIDSTSNDHDGTNHGATGDAGLLGNAQNFNGTVQYISSIVGNLPNAYSIGLIINTNAPGSISGFSEAVPTSGGHEKEFYINSNGEVSFRAYGSIGATVITSVDAVMDSQWHSLTGTAKANDLVQLYVDGTYNAAGPMGSLYDGYSLGYLTMGIESLRRTYFDGIIDEVRISTIARSAEWISTEYTNQHTPNDFYDIGPHGRNYSSSGALTSNVFDAEFPADWGILSYVSSGTGAVGVKVRTDSSSDMSGAADWAACDFVASGAVMAANDCVSNKDQYVEYQVTLTPSAGGTPIFEDITLEFSQSDISAPVANASGIAMAVADGGRSVASDGWNNSIGPHFSWEPGEDDVGGEGLMGYCLYLGTDPAGDPATAKGLLGVSPVSTEDTTCQFIVSGESIDFSTSSLRGDPWLTSSTEPYYLNIKAIDNSGNIYGGESATFSFRFDNTPPANMSYISCAAGSFSNVADMNFSWPTSGVAAASDGHATVLGWQYQLNSTSGEWLGTTTEAELGIGNYIPVGESSRTLSEEQDGDSIVSGNNVVYFRTVDAAGNVSTDATIRTCNLSYGGAAPSFNDIDTVAVTPSQAEMNTFSLSWPAANAADGQSVAGYYYMVNTEPPATLATLQGNGATYLANGTATSVSARSLPNVNKGSNTVYVVAIDDSATPNYSPSNYISGTFTLNSTNPDNVGDLVATDSSIKSQQQWNVTLTWTAPKYQGAGNVTYQIQRSTTGSGYATVGTTTGLSYVDNAPASQRYFYRIVTTDGADAASTGTNAVTITPTGRWTSPPALEAAPTTGNITTQRATISWATSRSADSRVQYGTASGEYFEAEISSSNHTTAHRIELAGLQPDTIYYYRAKWTDEDGNTGISEEKSFVTMPPPTVQQVAARNIGLSSAIIQFTVSAADSVKIYYGQSTNFGGVTEIATVASETTYTTELTGLADGTTYYYKINALDADGSEYEGTVLDFATLPRPEISEVRLEQVPNMAQSTIEVVWQSNTAISSIITYYPADDPENKRDEVDIELINGEHRMRLSALQPKKTYLLVVRGVDKLGNEAVSDSQQFTTATDTRPPAITDFKVEASKSPNQPNQSQLIISWNTDEPATSQVEYGQGRDTNFASRSPEDSALTTNHVVVIPGLAPSQVYRLRAISADSAGNITRSNDSVTITPKATSSALELVLENLSAVFGFLGDIKL